METSNTFTKTQLIERPEVLMEDIKQWLVDQKIIQPEARPIAYEVPNTYYGDEEGYQQIVGEDYFGKVELVTQRTELMHRLGWDWGVDFLLPDQVVCPNCGKNTIAGIDPATFYGESDLPQDPNEMNILQALQSGMPSWEAESIVELKCHHCGTHSPIESFDYNNSLIFTNFAVIFWNCPELKSHFVEALKEKVGQDVLFIQR